MPAQIQICIPGADGKIAPLEQRRSVSSNDIDREISLSSPKYIASL